MDFADKKYFRSISGLHWRNFLFHPFMAWAELRFVRSGTAMDYWRHEYFLKGSKGIAQRIIAKEQALSRYCRNAFVLRELLRDLVKDQPDKREMVDAELKRQGEDFLDDISKPSDCVTPLAMGDNGPSQ